MGTGLSLGDFAVRTIVPKADIDALTSLSWRYAGDSLPLDLQTETDLGDIPSSGSSSSALPAPTVTLVTLSVRASVTASDLNFATVSVYKRTRGGARSLVASGATTTAGLGALNPDVRYALALQGGGPIAVSYGDQLTVEISKAGAGVVLPGLVVVASYSPTFVDASLVSRWDWIWSRLGKRYIEVDPAPETILRWQEAMVTWDCYRRRGYTPGSAQDTSGIDGARNDAEARVLEAADGKDGLIELPVKPSGVSVGRPLSYTEASPFVAADRQEREGVCEDARGFGTYGGNG